MSDIEFLQANILQLSRLLDAAGDDPILAPQLRRRLENTRKELGNAKLSQPDLGDKKALPRAAIFMRGGAVSDSGGIRPSLAGEALIQYEKMFVEQALHDEREDARSRGKQRRARGTPAPQLLFTGTPRGSFGLEFVPSANGDQVFDELHVQSLRRVASALIAVAADGNPQVLIGKVPANVLQPMKKFLKTLADNKAELRLAFTDQQSQTISFEKIMVASEKLEREVSVDTVELSGTFRGLTFESGHFDFVSENLGTISGLVDENLSSDDLLRLYALIDKKCMATLQKTVVKRVGESGTTTYTLVDAFPS